MGSLLEEMHKMRLKEKIDELESMGGNSTCSGSRTWRSVSL
mgnify:CR=1 FL=1